MTRGKSTEELKQMLEDGTWFQWVLDNDFPKGYDAWMLIALAALAKRVKALEERP